MSEENKPNNPMAFPQPAINNNGRIDYADHQGYGGLAMRDYFAAAALQGFLANSQIKTRFDPKDDAEYCYKIADAMLKEREK